MKRSTARRQPLAPTQLQRTELEAAVREGRPARRVVGAHVLDPLNTRELANLARELPDGLDYRLMEMAPAAPPKPTFNTKHRVLRGNP